MPGVQPRKNIRFLLFSAILLFTFTIWLSFSEQPSRVSRPYAAVPIHHVEVSEETLHGDAIMPKLGNETLKAELGRAAWKVLHTTMSRFPDSPTEDESNALRSYLHLFARLYPCGECAGHFRKILEKFPPQVSTRSSAAAWACHVHNEVNKSLKKVLFDCSKIGDFYKCGCADDEGKEKAGGEGGGKDQAAGDKKVSGQAGGLARQDGKPPKPLELKIEG
ncbi:MAG: hypothetical protein M1829_002617 [Trizodia sp. TS-e1964]|nr:MAG: hypothetical protein M1829_002617 [Trizodia sp. TS-e1964]